MNTNIKAAMRPLGGKLRAGLLGLAIAGTLAGGAFVAATPASAQTIYDADIAERIRGITPQVRAQLRDIAKQSRAMLFAVLEKYGIDPDAKPTMDQLMKASKELQAVASWEKERVLPLLKPEERAQYYNMIAATTTRIRESLR